MQNAMMVRQPECPWLKMLAENIIDRKNKSISRICVTLVKIDLCRLCGRSNVINLPVAGQPLPMFVYI